MAKLIFSLDGAFLGDILLDKERMTIGRRPTNDIHIDNLAVSGEHAAISTIGNDSFLEDLGSTNGTLINGKTVTKHLLQHGDVIELGKYQLKYINESATTQAGGQEDFEKTMIIRPSAMKSPPLAAPAAPAAAAPSPAPAAAETAKPAAEAPTQGPVGKLQVLNGASMGKELILSKALTTLGKPGVQVAVITKRPQGYFITHVEGDSFPTVNGVSVGGQAHPLKDNDVVELAGIKMEFYFSPS
jgi:pSer/pThr/pTyr-binding forkhead associated (FHA) protein